jgi:hypothetical protein
LTYDYEYFGREPFAGAERPQLRRLEAAATAPDAQPGPRLVDPPATTGRATAHQARSNLLSMHCTLDRYKDGSPQHRRQVALIAAREAEFRTNWPDMWPEFQRDRDGQRQGRSSRQAQRQEAAAELARLAAPEIAAAAAIAAAPKQLEPCPPLRRLNKPCPACGTTAGTPCPPRPPRQKCAAPGCSSTTVAGNLYCGFHHAQAAAAATEKQTPATAPAAIASPAAEPETTNGLDIETTMRYLLTHHTLGTVLDAAWDTQREIDNERKGRKE